MSEEKSTLETLAFNLSAVLAPLSSALESPESLKDFLEQLGWQTPTNLSAIGMDQGLVDRVIVLLQEVGELDYDTAEAGTIAAAYGELLAGVAALAVHIFEVKGRIGAHLDAAFLAASHMAEELPRRLFDYLLMEYLAEAHPVSFATLTILGVVELTEIDRDDPTFTAQHTRHTIHFERLTKLITDPTGLFRDVYGWGTAEADLTLLIERLFDMAVLMGLSAELVYPDYEKEVNLSAPATIPDEGHAENLELRIPIIGSGEEIVAAEVGITLMPVPSATLGGAPGLALCPYATGVLSESVALDEQARWLMTIQGGLDLVVGIGLIFRPGETLKVLTDILGSSTSASGQLSIELRREALPDERILLLGTFDRTGLTAALISGLVSVVVGTGQETEFKIEFLVDGGRLRLAFDSVDSFMGSLLPSEPLDMLFDLGVGWSNRKGLYFTGGAGFEYSLPLHESIGPLRLDILHFGLGFKDTTIRTMMAITGGANLGVLVASVERIGVEFVLSFPGTGGNLGPANLAPTFKPPNGVGLAIDAGVVKGGGYLFFDFDKGEYAGLLELDLSGIVSVKAIGLITTRMPDGSPGFSLLLIITAEFGTPVQLGLGFTLSGVGGLLGLNRTMRLEVIATGIRDGGINSIMFPQNVVANAPRIISDLKKYFPVEEGTFLIGPMVKIGWGTPNLVTVSMGIIIEIPGNIAILGVLKVVLPDEEAALIVIQVNFIGAIEFDKSRLWFFAAIFESRILFITLEGEMGLLVGWGDEPAMVVSVGGFHPAFNPPPLPFGAIARISISILNTDFARIRVTAYFAVTSNSVQFGAAVELFFGVSAFNIDGHLSFDALFRFSPFYFIITISASLSVKVFGVGLFSVRMRGSLEGPTPWHVEGTGSISLLFFDIDVDFSHTWGNEEETTLPPIAVAPLLVSEFQKLENWLAVLPASNKLLVSIRNMESGTVDLILHPVGSLKISQRAVPLGLTIDKVGNQKPADANLFNVSVTTSGLQETGNVEESFAVGQFLAKSDDELLSAKSFEPLKGGVELSVSGDQYHAPKAVKRIVRYEKIIIDTYYKRFVKKFFPWVGVLASLFMNGNSAALSPLSNKQQKQLKPFADKVQIGKTLYVVAHNEDNTPYQEDAIGFTSQAQAQEYMSQQIAADANLAKQLHVIPKVEMQS